MNIPSLTQNMCQNRFHYKIYENDCSIKWLVRQEDNPETFLGQEPYKHDTKVSQKKILPKI
jgi:hypothetical protein